jgi:hypothetical protein
VNRETRPLLKKEAELIERLLSESFPGRDELLKQVPYTHVIVMPAPFIQFPAEDDPSMFLVVDRAQCQTAPVRSGPVAIGRYRALDGWNNLLLTVFDGYLSSVSMYSITALVPVPPPDDIEVHALRPPSRPQSVAREDR